MPIPGASHQAAEGYRAAVGETKTIQLGFYSDAPTAAWTITAREFDPFGTATAENTFPEAKDKTVSVSLDKTSGNNGDQANLTVNVLKETKLKTHVVIVVSKRGNTEHYMPLLVGGG
jgi:hypothetical protein